MPRLMRHRQLALSVLRNIGARWVQLVSLLTQMGPNWQCSLFARGALNSSRPCHHFNAQELTGTTECERTLSLDLRASVQIVRVSTRPADFLTRNIFRFERGLRSRSCRSRLQCILSWQTMLYAVRPRADDRLHLTSSVIYLEVALSEFR
ncbi:hypothetical protein NEOLEDRAFT_1141227 [Neolentinus lepideus HHB14362 ss-1]|uniref:Uncharacterized protein n=1 Tax=Neolentinus lepideus HHB14362 ss-1 TaxID=1314782 RepID=A0A165NS69_9AGAM|nr:hypothetical protein NEOLEDRAFT_1141227 [Neolentinus lepideus HHB14362 ss-1]